MSIRHSDTARCGSAQIVAAHIQLGGFTRKAKTSSALQTSGKLIYDATLVSSASRHLVSFFALRKMRFLRCTRFTELRRLASGITVTRPPMPNYGARRCSHQTIRKACWTQADRFPPALGGNSEGGVGERVPLPASCDEGSGVGSGLRGYGDTLLNPLTGDSSWTDAIFP